DHRLRGALLLERAGVAAMLYGPVVVASEPPDPDAAVEIAARLLDDALGYAEAQGIVTLYTRPQSLDRVWVRNGFIPIPEADLPEALRGRPGVGLFGWRGGTAIWSMARRAEATRGAPRGGPFAGGGAPPHLGPGRGGGGRPAAPPRRPPPAGAGANPR